MVRAVSTLNCHLLQAVRYEKNRYINLRRKTVRDSFSKKGESLRSLLEYISVLQGEHLLKVNHGSCLGVFIPLTKSHNPGTDPIDRLFPFNRSQAAKPLFLPNRAESRYSPAEMTMVSTSL